ncbi:hypothetical protein U9M48_030267 [Paspalum notatum var. saurae]|uniref:Reverse transcriptase zinc-binding domain-containing protein n=1 Tax=Paspalum notatum var. saurae TaxID=547442 RepID=A0AAQ3U500_PASNO
MTFPSKRHNQLNVLVNGQPGPPISHLRGLRQGDPLSPMLFILVMDVLNSLVCKACEENLLLPIAGQQNLNLHRISLTNLFKSSATPIQCSDEDVALTSEIADKLPGWKAPLLNKAGRLVLVKSVLTAAAIHMLIAQDLPRWVIKAIDKRRRGFLWKGQEQANRGNCLVSWERVQRPLCYGGLGVHDLDRLGCALRIRWLWLQKTDGSRPWAGLPVQVPLKARALFNMAVATRVGNGVSTFFWTDRWLEGKTVAELAPNLFSLIPKGIVEQRTVSQALSNRRWVEDIRGALTVQVLLEYLAIWDMVDGLVLQHDVLDQHVWKLSASGSYSSKSAYNAMFVGTIKFSPWRRVWKSWAPPKCKFFMWLAVNNRCWTSDRLARRGLPHQPACPFCDQAEETIHHILGSCVLAREVWVESSKALPKDLRKGFNTLFILVSWEIWKHRNDWSSSCGQAVLNSVGAEGHEWCLAGALGLQALIQRITLETYLHQRGFGGGFIGSESTVKSLLGNLGGLLAQEYTLIRGVAGDRQYITDELRTMQSFLHDLGDASEQCHQMKDWMKQIRDMTYDVEDCVDDSGHRNRNPRWLHPDVCCYLLVSGAYEVVNGWPRRDIASMISDLRMRAQQISERRQRYGMSNPETSKDNKKLKQLRSGSTSPGTRTGALSLSPPRTPWEWTRTWRTGEAGEMGDRQRQVKEGRCPVHRQVRWRWQDQHRHGTVHWSRSSTQRINVDESFCQLEFLHLDFCPCLIHVLGLSLSFVDEPSQATCIYHGDCVEQ